MKISYCITISSEEDEAKKLIPFLIENIRKDQDEICILLDKPKCPLSLLEFLKSYKSYNYFCIVESEFQNDFSEWKNKLFSIATKDFIFQIDCDEMITKELIQDLPYILENNNVDVLGIVRENVVDGLTQEWINKWGWRIDELNRINYPDTQLRILKRDSIIRWKNKVHEIPSNYSTISVLPENYYLIHHKKLEKQIKQNELYSKL